MVHLRRGGRSTCCYHNTNNAVLCRLGGVMWQMLNRWLTRCPVHLQEMGFDRELWGIRRRYEQFRPEWEAHCAQAKRVILDAVRRCSQHRHAILFGSGWLHDVPLIELSNIFQRVTLVDLLHPFSVRWYVRGRFSNVRLLEADLSGVLLDAWRAVERQESILPVSRPELFLDEPDVDLVVSLNLLSQLPCMPSWYLKKVGRFPEKQVELFNRQLVEAHLDYLGRLPGVVCLIGDVEMITRTPAGAEVARRSTLYGADFPFCGEEWEWQLIPRADRPPYNSQSLRVIAVPEVKQARGR
ncbi:MAG: hypothetical protein SNJ75_19720 [Gemmataceae bacterium]